MDWKEERNRRRGELFQKQLEPYLMKIINSKKACCDDGHSSSACEPWCRKKIADRAPLEVFSAQNLVNGFARPTNQPNAWVADFAHEQPVISLTWDKPQPIALPAEMFDVRSAAHLPAGHANLRSGKPAADFIVKPFDKKTLVSTLEQVATAAAELAAEDPPRGEQDRKRFHDFSLNYIVPDDSKMPYDMREIVTRIVDKGEFLDIGKRKADR